jgi:hypothetical protein
MLRLDHKRSLVDPSIWVPMPRVRIWIPATGAFGAQLLFRLDTGADRSFVQIGHAPALGLSEDDVRQQGTSISLRSATGQPATGYLLPVRHMLYDDYGGWMEWDAELAFVDLPKFSNLLGMHGFVNYLDRLTLRTRYTLLEPRPPLAGEYLVWQCSSLSGAATVSAN